MKRYLSVIMLSFVLFLVACTSDSDVETGSEEGEGGNGDLVLALPSDIVSLDPHGSNDVPSEKVRDVLYDGLVTQDDDNNIVEALATEWEQKDDNTYVFTLREDVKFHDDSEFTAEDVKASFERINDVAVASPRAFILEMIDEVKVIDDYTVEVTTEYPFVPLLNNLSHGSGKIISKELIDKDYENALEKADVDMTADEYYSLRDEDNKEYDEVAKKLGEHTSEVIEKEPSGTGNFAFDERNAGEKTVLKNFEDYWDGSPELETITYKVVTESGSRVAEIETESSDFISDVPTSNMDRVENMADVSLVKTESVSIDYIGFNTEKEPFDDVKVRQALTHAFDKQAVIDGVYNGSGSPLASPLIDGTLGYSEDIDSLDYDMDKAQELLEEAGYEDGFEVDLLVNEDNPQRLDMAVWLQESLDKLNVKVNVRQMEWGAYLDATGNGEHDMFILGWSNSTGDSDNSIRPLFHSEMKGSSGNRSFYDNSELDNLLDEGRQEFDEEKREEIYKEASQLVATEAPAIFVRHAEYLNAKSDKVHDFEINKYDLYDVQNTTIDD